MKKQVLLVVNKKYNNLHAHIGSSLDAICKEQKVQFEDTDKRQADSSLLGERPLDLPQGLEAYVDAIRSLERCFLGGGHMIDDVIDHALLTGLKLGVEHADAIRARQIWMR